MPSFNHAPYLPGSLDALLSQSLPPDEILVADDASTDDSLAILHAYAQAHPRIRVVANVKNLGPVKNISRLIPRARGEYVYLAASDDRVLPGFFEKSVGLLQRYPASGLCSTLSRVMDETGAGGGVFPTPIACRRPGYITPVETARKLATIGPWIQGNTVVHRREVLSTLWRERPALRSFVDGFFYQLVALTRGACFIPEPLAVWRVSENGYSRKTLQDPEALLDVAREVEKLTGGEFARVFTGRIARGLTGEILFHALRAARGREDLPELMAMAHEIFGREPGPAGRLADRVFMELPREIYLLYLLWRFRSPVQVIRRRAGSAYLKTLKGLIREDHSDHASPETQP